MLKLEGGSIRNPEEPARIESVPGFPDCAGFMGYLLSPAFRDGAFSCQGEREPLNMG